MNVSCFNDSCGKEVWHNKGLYQSGLVLTEIQILQFAAVRWGSWLNSRGHISLAVRLGSYHTEKSGWIACCSLLRRTRSQVADGVPKGLRKKWPTGGEGWAAAALNQSQGSTAGMLEHGRVGNLLRNWWNNSFWSLIPLQFEEMFEF